MDLTRPIQIQTDTDGDMLDINTYTQSPSAGVTGCRVDTVQHSLEIVQWNEPQVRANSLELGELSAGNLRTTLTGTLYGNTHAALYAALSVMENAFMPQQDERLLYYSKPTADLTNFPTGLIDLQLKGRPQTLRGLDNAGGVPVQRAANFGNVSQRLAIPWRADFLSTWPVATLRAPNVADVDASQTGSWRHHGDYPTPLSLTLVLDTVTADGTIDVQVGTVLIHFTNLAGPGRTLVYDGYSHLLYVDGVLAMGSVEVEDGQDFPVVVPGLTSWTVTLPTGTTLLNSSFLSFEEGFAP